MASGEGLCYTAPMKQKKTLSILIVSWNQSERLATCLAAVYRAHPEAQVVVVDNGSSPPLVQTDARITWIRSERNLGFAGGNALGFDACTGDTVLLLNNDAVLPSAQPVETLIAFLDAHPQVAAAQAKLILPDGTLDTCGEFLTPAGLLYHHGYRLPDGPHADHPFPIFGGKGACLLIRRSAIADVGRVLTRPSFFCYYEEIDLCHRLWLAGHEVWFVPGVPVFHDEGTSARLLPNRHIWQHYLSNLLTSAGNLWGWRAWLTMGPGFLLFLYTGALLKGVWPQMRHEPIVFTRRRSERDLLRGFTVRVPLRYYWAIATRRFSSLPPCPLPDASHLVSE